MIWGGLMVEQAIKLLKSERISGGALVLLAATLFWVHAWASDEFAKVEDLEKLQTTVDEGFESIAINDASQEIRDIKLSLQVAKATTADKDDLARIQDQLTHAIDYKKCLVDRGTNCEHLREVE
jgi:hypothetical protein